MEDPNSTLLPYILETLSRKPELCDTFENLCTEIEEQLYYEKNNKYGNVRSSIQRALTVGQSLGIITLTNETIRVPFNFRQHKNARAPNPSTPKPQSGGTPAEGGNPAGQTQDKNAAQRSEQNPNSPKPDEGDEQDDEYEYSVVMPTTRQPRRTLDKSRARSRSGTRRGSVGRPRARRVVRRRGRSGAMGRRYGRSRR